MPTFKTATVVYHNIPASKFHDVVVEASESIDYKPGQFVTVQVTDKEIRSYSIAGKLDCSKIGLLVDSTPGGHGSKYFEGLQTGDCLRFMGPFGHFTLHLGDGAQRLIFLATGCGVSPVKAMVGAALREHNLHLPMYFYFGLRYSSDIFWDRYFNDLQQQYGNFHFKLCLSKPDTSWNGPSGHITDLIKQDFPDASDCAAYICGNHHMVSEAIEVLKSLHCPEQRIYHEQYG